MKRTSVFVVLVLMVILLLGSSYAASIRPGILGGAYDELLPEAVKGKTFVPSIKFRWEYDDNIFTTTKGEKNTYGVSEKESWKLYVEPKIDVHLLSDTSYLGGSYQYSLLYYTDRPDDDTEMAHDAQIDVRHRFSPGLEVALTDIFRYSEEPEIAEDIVTAGGVRTLTLQRNGDYYYNRGSAAMNVRLSPQLWMNLNYANVYVDYDDAGVSYYYDRMINTAGGKLQYLATPESRINLGVTYANVDYDSDALRKDSDSWIGFVGLNQTLAKYTVGSITAGWENRDFSDVDISEDAPFVDVNIASGLGKKSNAKAGYRYGLTETAYAQFGAEQAHTLYAGVNAWLANWTSVHFNTSYEMAEFEGSIPGRATSAKDEDVWLLGIVLRQRVHRDMYLEVGYRRTDVSSDYDNSDYERNRYYVGFGGIF